MPDQWIIHVVDGRFDLLDGKMYLIGDDGKVYVGDSVVVNGLTCIECDGEFYTPKVYFVNFSAKY